MKKQKSFRGKRILLVSIGTGKGTELGIIKSIKEIRPHILFAFMSKDGREVYEKVKNFGWENERYDFDALMQVVDPDNPDDIFKKAYKLIAFALEGKAYIDDIYINYTSGTKSMSSGLVAAGVMLGVKKYVYVSGTKRDEYGRVIPGYETVKIYSLPDMMLNLKIQEIKNFFNKSEFIAADSILNAIGDELGINIENEEILKQLLYMVNAYKSWEQSNYKDAFENLKKINVNYLLQNSRNKNLEREISKNKEILSRLIKSLENDDNKFVIFNKIAEAIRYKEKGFILLSANNIYSALEMVSEYILEKKYEIKKSEISISKLKELLKDDEKVKKYVPVEAKEKFGIGLYQSYFLLNDLGNEFGKDFVADKKLQKSIKVRNEWVHGGKYPEKKKVDEFIKNAEPYFEKFLIKYGNMKEKKLKDILEKYKFPVV